MITVKQIKSVKPGQNPLDPTIDFTSMGKLMGTNVFLTYTNHEVEYCKSLIVVNIETGERVKIDFSDDPSGLAMEASDA